MANKNNGNTTGAPAMVRCAIYTRKSTEEGLGQDFNFGVYPEFGGRDAQRPKNQRVKVFHKWARQFPHSTAPRKLDSAT